MHNLIRLTLICLVACLSVRSAQADEFTPAQRAEIVAIMRDALKRDPSILRDAVSALDADDTEQRRAQIVAARDKLETPDDQVAGNPNGDVTIVEFFDTNCPYCRKLEPVMSDLLARDHGVRLVYKDLPILGPSSVLGAKALLAAQRQGRYEKLRGELMAAPPPTNKATIKNAAMQTGIDWSRLERDMNDPAIQAHIDANLKLAQAIGVDGTPVLIIGSDVLPGAVDFDELQKAVVTARNKK